MLKVAVVRPIPKLRATTAAAEWPGALARMRPPNRISRQNVATGSLPRRRCLLLRAARLPHTTKREGNLFQLVARRVGAPGSGEVAGIAAIVRGASDHREALILAARLVDPDIHRIQVCAAVAHRALGGEVMGATSVAILASLVGQSAD